MKTDKIENLQRRLLCALPLAAVLFCFQLGSAGAALIPVSVIAAGGDISTASGIELTSVIGQSIAGFNQDGSSSIGSGALPALVNLAVEPVSCGASAGQAFNNVPGDGLCSGGAPSTPAGTGPWNWTCQGIGGTSISCGANIQIYSLIVNLVGTGAGTITSNPQGTNPAGIACTSGTCATLFTANTVVALSPTADALSTFGNWSGDCTGAGACGFAMTATKTVTASFLLAPRARIGASEFATLTAAYAGAGSVATILALDTEFIESLNLGAGKVITLKGGYKADYSGRSGLFSYLKGKLAVGTGRLTVDRVGIR